VFRKHGHSELDTARVYGGGSSEEYLGQLDWQKRGIVMETKLYPTKNAKPDGFSHSPEDLRKQLLESLKALKTDKIETWYLHAPDRSTPFDVTFKAVNDLHKEGYFKRLGVSNYMAWEVAYISDLCIQNGWIRPTLYQGVYNGIHRSVETELFPCLKHYKISFYAFNPLAGGYLTNRYHRETADHEGGSRFDPNTNQGRSYRKRYWNDATFDALDIVRAATSKHNITEAESAIRWITHHSQLKREHGDAIIIGASSTNHLEQNLADFEKGPLPEDVVEAYDQAWAKTKGVVANYFH
jgi:aflatoxin B1 aldehyde reductase